MNILEIIKIVSITSVVVVIFGIGLKKVRWVLNQSDNDGNLALKMRWLSGFVGIMLWTAAFFNVIALGFFAKEVFGNEFVLVPASSIIISFFTSLIVIVLIYKRHIPKGKAFAIINLVFSFLFFLHNLFLYFIFSALSVGSAGFN